MLPTIGKIISSLSEFMDEEKYFLRILLKQNTALLSYVCVLVSHRRDISSFLDNLTV